jgi:hypothetical protein
MPKCQHCGNVIEGNQIAYREPTTGRRRTSSMRLCWRCADRHDKTESGKKLRNIVLAAVALVALIIVAGYVFAHR